MKRLICTFLALLFTVSSTSALSLQEFSQHHSALLPARGTPVDFSENAENSLSFDKNALLSSLFESSLTEIRDAILLGLVTSREVTAYFLERIETYNEKYNCFITLFPDSLEKAAEKDEKLQKDPDFIPGPLYGVPVIVKDNIHVAGYLTTNGLSKNSSKISENNAKIVENLINSGAIILGKANMSTEAQDARASRSAAVGETKNAYNTTLASGGSSGGSAVSVSLNFAPAALGTDTNSSLRVPAALAGCVALRVTTGLLSRDGVILLNSARDVPGAITRSVEDQALMLDVLSGGETDFLAQLDATILPGTRIGILKQLTYAYSSSGERRQENLDPEVQAAFAAAAEELRACGAEVVEVSMPSLFSLSEATFPVGGYKKIPALTAAFEEFLQKNDLDAVIFPTYLSAPLRSGKDENGTYWNVYDQVFINNCRTLSPSAAVPEITVPIGCHSLGAGMGMQIAGPQYSEQLLLNIAHAYTQQYDHRIVPAAAPDLYEGSNSGTLQELTEEYLRSLLLPEKTLGQASEARRLAAAAVKMDTDLLWREEKNPLPLLAACLGGGAAAAAVVILLINSAGRRKRYRGRRVARR